MQEFTTARQSTRVPTRRVPGDRVPPPPELSRGLVLVKWWLLAVPHHLIIAVFTGGVLSWSVDPGQPEGGELVAGGGLIGLLSFVAVVARLFSGRYPRGLFDLTMGLQRWVYRVVAYVSLMTDQYPPFRLDPGGQEPGGRPRQGNGGPGRSPTRTEHTGQAFHPCRPCSRSARRICSSRVASCGIPVPPTIHQLSGRNCRPP